MTIRSETEEISRKEREAVDLFRTFVAEHQEELMPVARWGDGDCGYLWNILREALLPSSSSRPKAYTKAKIGAKLRTQVFERDAYRCVYCGSWTDLCADHIHPEAKGGSTTLDNLQTLCRRCNSKKGDRA